MTGGIGKFLWTGAGIYRRFPGMAICRPERREEDAWPGDWKESARW
jgi:hypothetical protein